MFVQPQNLIMMGPSPADGVKIVDFGLSRAISQHTELTQIMGTPDYVGESTLKISFEIINTFPQYWTSGVTIERLNKK